jgi:hypothetical protein
MALETYGLNDIDEASNSLTYEGYEDAGGAWYIRRLSKSGKTTAIRYVRGASDYAAAWASRAALSYQLFGTTF